MMTFDVAARLLTSDERRWVFAKTMPENPHHYTQRKEWKDDALFCDVVLFIRAEGQTEIFKGRRFKVLVVGEYKYWTVGEPLPACRLINRASVKDACRTCGEGGFKNDVCDCCGTSRKAHDKRQAKWKARRKMMR